MLPIYVFVFLIHRIWMNNSFIIKNVIYNLFTTAYEYERENVNRIGVVFQVNQQLLQTTRIPQFVCFPRLLFDWLYFIVLRRNTPISYFRFKMSHFFYIPEERFLIQNNRPSTFVVRKKKQFISKFGRWVVQQIVCFVTFVYNKIGMEKNEEKKRAQKTEARHTKRRLYLFTSRYKYKNVYNICMYVLFIVHRATTSLHKNWGQHRYYQGPFSVSYLKILHVSISTVKASMAWLVSGMSNRIPTW